MTATPLPEIDYFGLSRACEAEGFRVHEVFDQDAEIARWEFFDESADLHAWIFPRKPEFVIIEGTSDGKKPHEQSFEYVPVPSEVQFPEYTRLFEVLKGYAYSGDGEF
jgi:hypothetical protein